MHAKLLHLFPDATDSDWTLQDDANGNGPYIKEWNRIEPQPSQAEIDAVDDATAQESADDRRAAQSLDRDAMVRTLVELLYQADARLRVLESRAAIDKPTFIAAVKTEYRSQ